MHFWNFYMTINSPPIKYKERRRREINYNTFKYSRRNSDIWLKYLFRCWSILPKNDPSKVNLCSYRRFVFETSVWRMSVFTTILSWVKVKTMIFHMANLVAMLPFDNFLLRMWRRKVWNRWRWTAMKKSCTLKFYGLCVTWNMKGCLLIISKTCFVLVPNKLFLRSNDGLGSWNLNFYIYMKICSWNGYWMWIELNLTNFITCWLSMGVCVNL